MARLHHLAICDILKGTEKQLAFPSWFPVLYPPVSLYRSLKQSTSPGRTRKRQPSLSLAPIFLWQSFCGGVNISFPNASGIQECGKMGQ